MTNRCRRYASKSSHTKSTTYVTSFKMKARPSSPASITSHTTSTSVTVSMGLVDLTYPTSLDQAIFHAPPSMPAPIFRPAYCPTCSTNAIIQLYTFDGRRKAAACSECFTRFEHLEPAQRHSHDLTSFPSLLEERRSEGHGDARTAVGNGTGSSGVTNGTVYGTLKCVFSGQFPSWVTRQRQRQRSRSESSIGSVSTFPTEFSGDEFFSAG